MDSSNATLFLSSNGAFMPYLSSGVKENHNRITKLIEYCCNTHQEAINIRDLTIEPLTDTQIPSSLNSCLIVPIYLKSQSKAVLCFFRESKEFSKTDSTFANLIGMQLSQYKNLAETRKIRINLMNADAECDSLRKFSIPQEVKFDFYQFFYETKLTLGNYFNLSSCSIYVADQKNEQLWTRNSNSSSSLLFPFNSETLIGKTYEDREIIHLPDNKFFMLSDLEVFQDKFVISLPIYNESFKDPIIGVLVLTRKERKFSEIETWVIEKYTENLAQILEHIFVSHFPQDADEEAQNGRKSIAKSPNSMFREVNKEKFMFFAENVPDKEKLSLAESWTGLSWIPSEKFFEIQAILKDVGLKNDPRIFYKQLHELANCKAASYYTLYDFDCKLENLGTKQRSSPSELFKHCLETKKIIYIQNGQIIFPENHRIPQNSFPVSTDYLNQEIQTSLLIMPIFNNFSTVVGILHFVNFKNALTENDVKYLQSLGLFVWLMGIDIESKNWQEIIEETRGQHSLQKWSSILLKVANTSIGKLLLCKNAIYNLVNCNEIREVIKICLNVICAVMDCSNAEILIELDGSLCKITKKGHKYIELDQAEYDKISKFLDNEKITREKNPKVFTMHIPIIHKFLRGYLKLEDDRSVLEKKFKDFRVENDEILMELCRKIGAATYSFPDTNIESLESLSQSIKMIALQYKPFALNCVINLASRSLVDGERSTYFTYKHGKLIVENQGINLEIPKNYIVDHGKGIVSRVFANNKAEIIQDVYSDDSFDPVIDKLTGYKTANLICIPLITDFEKFGALEVLNKRTGRFNTKDLNLLTKFGEVVCMVLEIMNTMQITLEERFRLLAISNTMENYILVFNEHRNLVYINKPIDKIFGVSQEHIMNLTYFAWLHGNKGLMEDLQSVFENSQRNIRKTFQKIKTKRPSSLILKNSAHDNVTINYRISHLQNFSSECFSGVILIIEDATALERLHKEFKEVQKEIRILASPIGSETKLQKCINELSVILSHVDNYEMKQSLTEVINRLKGGGLKKPKLRIDSNEYNVGAITSILDIPGGDSLIKTNSIIEISEPLTISDSKIPLEELRNWDLNTIGIKNQFEYVYSMLNDFHLIELFQVQQQVLFNFTSSIKIKCNQWNNPFHNFNHCFNVMHGVYMMLATTPFGGFFKELEIYCLLTAAICHDVDHRGKGNMFEVHSRSEIATVYHDKSVLEQHHAAVTFFTLQEEGCNIFSTLTREQFNKARKLIITSILGTDMSKHLLMLENMASRFKDANEKPLGTLDKDTEKLAQLIIHAGDLSHPCKSFKIYEVWSVLVCQEFSDQYKEEVRLGLPITEFMKDLDNPRVYYANEVGFLNFVVKPLWECVNIFIAPHVDVITDRLHENIAIMKNKLEEWKKAEGIDNKN